jgi:hypothetical protein
MAYYKDFTVCGYFPENTWLCRSMAVGWIEHGRPFETGDVPAGLVQKLQSLRREFEETFPRLLIRGLHSCTVCENSDSAAASLDGSHVNLFIPHRGFVFVAPGRIDHYIEAHRYQPPESFVSSVLECPSPSSAEYREMVRIANRGVEAPLYA